MRIAENISRFLIDNLQYIVVEIALHPAWIAMMAGMRIFAAEGKRGYLFGIQFTQHYGYNVRYLISYFSSVSWCKRFKGFPVLRSQYICGRCFASLNQQDYFVPWGAMSREYFVVFDDGCLHKKTHLKQSILILRSATTRVDNKLNRCAYRKLQEHTKHHSV